MSILGGSERAHLKVAADIAKCMAPRIPESKR